MTKRHVSSSWAPGVSSRLRGATPHSAVTKYWRKFIQQDLVWDAVSHATHYDVRVGSSSTIINAGTATSYNLGGYFLPNIGSVVTGYVRACNSNGCSAWVKGSGI